MINKLDLKRIRKERGLTQSQLAKMLNFPQSYISYIESFRSSPSQEFQDAIKNTLKIEDLSLYEVTEEDAEQGLKTFLSRIDEQQNTINRLLDMIDRRDQRINELEQEVALLLSSLRSVTKALPFRLLSRQPLPPLRCQKTRRALQSLGKRFCYAVT